MMQTRLAIFGAGGISRAHVAATRAVVGRALIAAVIEPRQDARAALVAANEGCLSYASADAFFASKPREIANAVVLCTPPDVRVDLVRRSLDAGLAVLVEKPLAHTLSDARALVELARAFPHVPAIVGYCHRFAPAIVEIKRRIDAGELGALLRFESTFSSWQPAMRDHWMSDPAVSGGGSLMDTGCHSLDLYRHLVGAGGLVAASFGEQWSGRGESTATVLIRPTNAAKDRCCVGVIQSGWTEPMRFELRVTGTAGSIMYDYERPTELQIAPSESPRLNVEVETHESRFARQLAAFADLVSGANVPAVTPASFDDGLAVAELVDAAMRAGHCL